MDVTTEIKERDAKIAALRQELLIAREDALRCSLSAVDAESRVDALRDLLVRAKCPDCDGSGVILHQFAPSDQPEPTQCQFCYLRAGALDFTPYVGCVRIQEKFMRVVTELSLHKLLPAHRIVEQAISLYQLQHYVAVHGEVPFPLKKDTSAPTA